MDENNNIPRRAMLTTMVPAELGIHEAVNKIELLGADERLTNAINLMWQAKEMISDYVDENGITAEAQPATFGEQIVRTEFNPSNVGNVSFFKDTTAQIINVIDQNRDLDPRLADIAVTTYEEATMWAVKLATAKK